MAGRTVSLRVGGQTYRVVTSASEDELQRLAAVVDDKLSAVVPKGRPVTPQAMLLAAISLAHELEEERARSQSLAERARGAFGKMLERVDAALAGPVAAEPAPKVTVPRASSAPAAERSHGGIELRPVPRGDG